MTDGHTGRLEAALDGKYRIERKLGEGGMASVYLAEDIKHERKVALKILRPELAAVIGAERFLTEIKTTANLQHPHILALFDSGEADGYLYYVMPYIEGETLEERIDREGQLGVEEAVRIARDVADALDYAHRNDIIHRDIKPANILLHDGRPVVADFGIALAISAAGGGRMTETGLSLGTPHYMSPEQASADRDLSARSDVYSLGCVLYEMLAGQPPHTGPSAQSILVRILTEDPRDVTELRRTVPPHIAATVMKSIEKLPADRFDTARQFVDALADRGFTHTVVPRAAATGAAAGIPKVDASARPASPLMTRAMAGLTLLLAALAAWGWLRPEPEDQVRRLVVILDSLRVDFGPRTAISPDGSHLVYTGSDGNLWLRPLSTLEARPIPETDGARAPFFSPDGKRVGFHRGLGESASVGTVSLEGAPPVEVARGDIYPGATWSDDGYIYFANGLGNRLLRVGEEGGLVEVVSDSSEAGFFVMWPEVLPGGEVVLGYGQPAGEATEGAGVMAIRTETGEAIPLLREFTGPQTASTVRYAGGYLFWRTVGRTLMAAPFDVDRVEVTGPPVALTSSIVDAGQLSGEFDVAEDGTLIYAVSEENVTVGLGESMVWIGLDGSVEPVDERLADDIGDLDFLSLSPDGRRIAAEVQTGTDGSLDEEHHVRIYDRDQRTLVVLTFEGARNEKPRWLDDSRVAFHSNRVDGEWGIYEKHIDGGEARRLFGSTRQLSDFAVSGSDGRLAVTVRRDDGRTSEIVYVDPASGSEATAIVSTPFTVGGVDLSPNGSWMAYASDESGRAEVYVRSFPDGDRPAAISVAGGWSPRWGPSGTEIFWVGSGGSVMRAELDIRDRVSVASRETLFQAQQFELTVVTPITVPGVASYQVVENGERVLAVAEAGGMDADRRVLVLNVFQELRERSN